MAALQKHIQPSPAYDWQRVVRVQCETAEALLVFGEGKKTEAIAALRKAGGNPKYTEYPGVGHDSYRNAFKEPELLPWMFNQHRNSGPTR